MQALVACLMDHVFIYSIWNTAVFPGNNIYSQLLIHIASKNGGLGFKLTKVSSVLQCLCKVTRMTPGIVMTGFCCLYANLRF